MHVTLTTGDSRRSYRSEVLDGVIPICQDYLRRARDGVVDIDGLLLTVAPEKAVLLATISNHLGPLVTLGVADHSRRGAKLWRLLIETATTPIAPLDCPPEPWCAVRLERGMSLASRDTAMLLGDLERCLAWAWIER